MEKLIQTKQFKSLNIGDKVIRVSNLNNPLWDACNHNYFTIRRIVYDVLFFEEIELGWSIENFYKFKPNQTKP